MQQQLEDEEDEEDIQTYVSGGEGILGGRKNGSVEWAKDEEIW